MSFMLRSKSEFGRKGSRTGSLIQLQDWDRTYRYFPLFAELSPYHCLSLPNCRVSISKLMVTCLNDRMMNTHNGRGDPEPAHPNGNLLPPPTLVQAIASILEFCDEQTELLRQLMANSAHGVHGARNAPTPTLTTYDDFVAIHRQLFTEVGEPLEADHWLRVIESKFGLLHCMEVQKTLFTAQQLRGDTSAWWANYAATRPADYQVPWTESHSAFRAHHIPAGVMRKKRQEFIDLKQGGRFEHDYSKLFNHLA
jgi:hypothetical protein